MKKNKELTSKERIILSSSIAGFVGMGIKIIDEMSELIKIYPDKLNSISLFIFNSLGIKKFIGFTPTEQLTGIFILVVVSMISVSSIKSNIKSIKK